MTTTRPIFTVLALACTLGACKQEPTSVDSGVPTDKQGSELTPAEQAQLCDSIEEYTSSRVSDDQAKRYACTTLAITATVLSDGDAAACKILLDGCLQDDGMPPGEAPECQLAITDWSACMATVAELEACYTDIIDAQIDNFRSLSCDKIEEYKTAEPAEPMQSESCSRADAKCPGAGSGTAQADVPAE